MAVRHKAPPGARLRLIGAVAALAIAIATAGSLSSPSTAVGASHRPTLNRKGKTKKPAGPSLSVLGFGVNRLFVPRGSTVKASRMCDEIVDSDTPIGPPQQVYLTVYLRAIALPKHAPTQIKDSLPLGYEELDNPELTPPVPFSRLFSGTGFAFGAPGGSQKNLFHNLIVSFNAEHGSYEGPSAEEFDGTYSYTASAKVGPHTLTSTATVTVACPLLR
jgi:hypothetical protein